MRAVQINVSPVNGQNYIELNVQNMNNLSKNYIFCDLWAKETTLFLRNSNQIYSIHKP